MWRKNTIQALKSADQSFDVLVMGGGATGLGIAVDAASRGYSTVLLERDDFAQGTSSRSTKLAHGGVRYLAQGNIRLVMEALKERGLMRKNAPNLVRELPFIVPAYRWWEIPFYLVGLKVYDLLSGRLSFGKSRFLSASKVVQKIPSVRKQGLKGGVLYYDGQFDDSRMAVSLAKTADQLGARVLNYAEPVTIRKNKDNDDYLITIQDHISHESFSIAARAVFNATGVFVDTVPQAEATTRQKLIAPSRGAHIVLDRRFLQSHHALMIPKTADGRVLFAIPWYGKALIGTTDTPVNAVEKEPTPSRAEIQFILDTAQRFMDPAPGHEDIRAVFAGLRPLAAPQKTGAKTKEISRGHRILVREDETITIIGGKWTTYRKMAEDALDKAIAMGRLPQRSCRTEELKLWVSGGEGKGESELRIKSGVTGEDEVEVEVEGESEGESENEGGSGRGSESVRGGEVVPGYPWTEEDVRYMIREEYAMKIEDLLSRRMRILVLDAEKAIQAAPRIADILSEELGDALYSRQDDLESFLSLAKKYVWKQSIL